MINIAIAGATGYTGSELLRLLYLHPEARVIRITSEQHSGAHLSEVFPQFGELMDLTYESLDAEALVKDADLVFLALPHTLSMEIVPRILEHGVRLVDLSADFRLKNVSQYRTWYKVDHTVPELLKQSVYGLPELYRNEITEARLLANPGCYPTCALLGLAPLIKGGFIQTQGIVIDAKSGISGAGKTPKPHLHFPEANEALAAYRIGEHQHTPEIEQEISRIAEQKITLNFTPHLIPMNRGLLCTSYGILNRKASTGDLVDAYKTFYADEPFIRVHAQGSLPNTRDVRGTNRCDIGLKVDERTGRVIVVSVIDNLVKGASGQAVQNMNLMMGIKETTGLDLPPLTP
ncbi:MAG: N-acetyl-gamma-glutamyl-phosphate reductase [bacterium]